MNDIEHDLRTLLSERAARIVTAPVAPEQVLRRGRRRQVWTIAVGSLASITVIVASFAGLRGLVADEPDIRPSTSDEQVVTRGRAASLEWTLSAWIDGDRYCTRLRWRLDADRPGSMFGSTSCGSAPAHDRATFAVTDDAKHPISLLVALVPADVVRVEVRAGDGQRPSTQDLVDAPAGWGSLRFAVVRLEGRGSGAVQFIGEGGIAYPSVGFRWGQAPDISQFATVPGDGNGAITAEIGSIELEGARRTLFAWRETGTSKFLLYLGEGEGSREAMAWAATVEGVEDEPIVSIGPLACDRQIGVLWGSVPARVAAIDGQGTGVGFPRIETLAGPPELGDVRFVLASLDQPYPGSAWIRFLDAEGRPVDQDWLSATCFERPPVPPEA